MALGMTFIFKLKLRIWDSTHSTLLYSTFLLSGPAVVAWLGGSHTDSRFRRGMGGTLHPEYEVRVGRTKRIRIEWDGMG